jgi:dolichol-phosphate mannosyltransferase
MSYFKDQSRLKMNGLSIIIPVFNEQENVTYLAEEIEHTFKHVDFNWEVIWVDDFSDDLTKTSLQKYATEKKRHRIISLPQRSGQSAAVLNGVQISNYSLIGTLDGDGQNSPADLITLKELLKDTNSYLAQGFRVNRQDDSVRKFSTELANGFRRKVLKDNFNDVGCAVRVFKKEILVGLPAFKGWHRFFPVIISFLHPHKVVEHPVSHRKRWAGDSKYGVWNRLWVGLYDLVGMLWFKNRMITIYTAGEDQWKNSSTELGSLDRSSSPVAFFSSGLQAREQISQ